LSLLEVEGLRGGYGGVDILRGCRLAVEDDAIVVVIGPNGAGKSTLMKAIFGLIRVREGHIRFAGEDITRARPDQLVPKGMSYVPQERNVFASLSVQENLDMGAYIRRDDYRAELDAVFELFPLLHRRRHQPVGLMSGGERQMVAMGRALMVKPRLLMLDEPTAGLSPKFIDLIFERVRAINARGIAVLMVEQNAKKALGFADRAYVLVQGANRFDDTGPALLANPEIAELFLGGGVPEPGR
jgi:branched-chain amino acid transport system ATP-binding protein